MQQTSEHESNAPVSAGAQSKYHPSGTVASRRYVLFALCVIYKLGFEIRSPLIPYLDERLM